MDKKGISPLIVTVLLIGFSVIAFAFVLNYVTEPEPENKNPNSICIVYNLNITCGLDTNKENYICLTDVINITCGLGAKELQTEIRKRWLNSTHYTKLNDTTYAFIDTNAVLKSSNTSNDLIYGW